MLNVYLMVGAIDKDVVEVDNYKLLDEWAECLIHYLDEGAMSITQPKWHHQPFIEHLLCLECVLPLITNPHLNFVVPTFQIQLYEYRCPTQLIQ